MLSTMSNDFGNLKERAQKCGLFEEVYMFEEKEFHFTKRVPQQFVNFNKL